MIRINQIKITLKEQADGGDIYGILVRKAAARLKTGTGAVKKLEISRKSIDARKKPVSYVYSVDVEVDDEKRVLKRSQCRDVVLLDREPYSFPVHSSGKASVRPVVVGTGPAGLFCALMLARSGYAPLLIERGGCASKRRKAVEHFWATGELDTSSNVQFGEGGAGTFSDGKLNTLVKDRSGRGRLVLETFVSAGAPEDILYESKPHLGTDVLIDIVGNIRREIERLGGMVMFDTLLTDLIIEQGAVRAVEIEHAHDGGAKAVRRTLETDALVLAIGHSARDTFYMLGRRGVPMERKAFAVGVRIEHPQSLIDEYQYGTGYPPDLPPAAYKLARKTSSGRGVYSFCMCPGGYVVNASSELMGTAVNGMSYSGRDGSNANSAMVVTVNPEDFGEGGVTAGVEFQRRLERAAYREGRGKVPVQTFEDFCRDRPSAGLGDVEPCIKGGWEFGNVRGIFPNELSAALEEGIRDCGRIIRGFDRADAVLSGVESRTSSPVRILRDENLESGIKSLFPCGEGAGYAGGITSAAVDGIKVAEKVALRLEEGFVL